PRRRARQRARRPDHRERRLRSRRRAEQDPQARDGAKEPARARDGARPRRDRTEPGPRQERQAAARGTERDLAAERRADRVRRPDPGAPLPAARTRARWHRDAAEQLTWGDFDEPRGRWRVSSAASKTGRARWVQVPVDLFAAVCELVPREDRVPERR